VRREKKATWLGALRRASSLFGEGSNGLHTRSVQAHEGLSWALETLYGRSSWNSLAHVASPQRLGETESDCEKPGCQARWAFSLFHYLPVDILLASPLVASPAHPASPSYITSSFWNRASPGALISLSQLLARLGKLRPIRESREQTKLKGPG
jgi:hypothetical protein